MGFPPLSHNYLNRKNFASLKLTTSSSENGVNISADEYMYFLCVGDRCVLALFVLRGLAQANHIIVGIEAHWCGWVLCMLDSGYLCEGVCRCVGGITQI